MMRSMKHRPQMQTTEQVRRDLLERTDYPNTQKALAKQLGVSLSYLCQVIRNRREPGGKMLVALGLRRVMLYEKVPRKRGKK